jgi:hypothetical protein
MAARIVRDGRGRRRLFAAAVALASFASPCAVGAAMLDVVLDQAQIIKLPERVATVVVGNPAIADVSIQAGGIMVVTGKSYGSTNILALDRGGRTLLESSVLVRGADDNVVVVYRGVERETWSCTPRCERRFTLGDAQAVFDTTAVQIGTRNALGQTGAPPPKN